MVWIQNVSYFSQFQRKKVDDFQDCMIDPTKKELNHVATDFFLASVQAWQDSGCFYSPFLKHSAYRVLHY